MKMPRITNIWAKMLENEMGEFFSRVVIESTGYFENVIRQSDWKIMLEGSGIAANMPIGAVEVNDGLIRNIYLTQAGADKIRVIIDNEHPSEFEYEVIRGMPVRFIINMERSFISKLFHGKKIVIDPGHGGVDTGGRGPVNLVEKNVVMPIALNLQKLFKQAGSQVFLTRQEDLSVSPRERCEVARRNDANLFVSIHTHSNQDNKAGGLSVLYSPVSPESAKLAWIVKEELARKLKLADRGIKKLKAYSIMGPIPAIEVEVVTITNWVEEGLLRSPTVHKKAAEGIFNGVKNYLARSISTIEVVV